MNFGIPIGEISNCYPDNRFEGYNILNLGNQIVVNKIWYLIIPLELLEEKSFLLGSYYYI